MLSRRAGKKQTFRTFGVFWAKCPSDIVGRTPNLKHSAKVIAAEFHHGTVQTQVKTRSQPHLLDEDHAQNPTNPMSFQVRCLKVLSVRLKTNGVPDTIVSPLFTANSTGCWDAYDVARLLGAYKFQGRLIVDTGQLPNPEMVLRELRPLCPEALVSGFDAGATQLRAVGS